MLHELASIVICSFGPETLQLQFRFPPALPFLATAASEVQRLLHNMSLLRRDSPLHIAHRNFGGVRV